MTPRAPIQWRGFELHPSPHEECAWNHEIDENDVRDDDEYVRYVGVSDDSHDGLAWWSACIECGALAGEGDGATATEALEHALADLGASAIDHVRMVRSLQKRKP